MRPVLRPLDEQTIAITGASSGIGLATARMAARRGARVVLTSRNGEALAQVTRAINDLGGRAAFVVADVADADALVRVADAAVREFGGLDTWINNAGVTIYGRLDEVPLADKRRVMDVNFWGTVHGCRAALPHLRERGGAIVNVGSVLGDRAIPLQGIYAAATHAVKAYTDSLRMELEAADAPVAVSLVKPSSINTPFYEHAKSYLGVEPAPPPPVYQPETAAAAILRCATHVVRDVTVGAGGRALSGLGELAPRLTDRVLERTMFRAQRSEEPIREDRRDNLYEPGRDGRVKGLYTGPALERSAYTAMAIRPEVTALAVAGIGLALAAAVGAARRRA